MPNELVSREILGTLFPFNTTRVSMFPLDTVIAQYEHIMNFMIYANKPLYYLSLGHISNIEDNNKVVYFVIYHLFIIVVYHAITLFSGNFNTRVVYNNHVPSSLQFTSSLVNG